MMTFRKNLFRENPFPGDDRFEPVRIHDNRFDLDPELNIEHLSKHRNTSHAPMLNKASPRKIEFANVELSDGLLYNKLYQTKNEKQNDLNMGALRFETRTKRIGIIDNNPIKKLEYDSMKLEKGVHALAHMKKVKGHVQLNGQTQRDNSMYNFDKTNIRDLSRGLNKVNYTFKFSDQLPNYLDMR